MYRTGFLRVLRASMHQGIKVGMDEYPIKNHSEHLQVHGVVWRCVAMAFLSSFSREESPAQVGCEERQPDDRMVDHLFVTQLHLDAMADL